MDAVDRIYDCDLGPLEGTSEHIQLEKQHGFSYRTLLGELLFAYVCARPDIGYSVTTLSKFSQCPAAVHYHYLKGIAKYLRRTICWKIYYTKPQPDPSLTASSLTPVPLEPNLPLFPVVPLDQLTAFVDAEYANDKRNRRSTTGYVFTLAGGAIAYKSKTQSITATSSTEAEFLAAVVTAKAARFLRAVLSDLNFRQVHPTPIYEDNAC
jgi:hypothetical protein